ncbi:hypothetical protein PQ469_03375 [Mucilaginibacter sp. KACC 22773]|uniref:GNAT family N-acetyltransferase n=1 Tax=Mucilaginibacter sp. KACC 22773 TaxID=3025671 RepID=UPI002366DDE2|nr:GNAT family N-acetyltransferase [Mucilaginibacter sp. KACC 22773]WDF79046.1 hypothetical protein PQ469_03375 [Mucilaginibacter sp. KACC 22773]
MSDHVIQLLSPAECSKEQLAAFYELVLSGKQVDPEGLEDRIARADTLAFFYIGGQVAGVASVKNQKRSYITGIFLKAKVPGMAESYRYEIGYAVTHQDFRRLGISTKLVTALQAGKPGVKLYATTKNDDMRDLLVKSGFTQAGSSYKNAKDENLSLFVSA